MTCAWCSAPIPVGRVYCSRSCAGRGGNPPKGVFVASDGRAYVTLRREGRKQLYSRCLMEGHLKRHLAYEEVVHHVNGDPTDDRLENLVVIDRATHLAEHRAEIVAARNAKHCKLTPANVAEILASPERPSVLAQRFGVSPSLICWHRKKSELNALRDEMRAVAVTR